MKDDITFQRSGIVKLFAVVAGIAVTFAGCASESQDSSGARGDAPSGSFSEAVWFPGGQQFDGTLEEWISSLAVSQAQGSDECPWGYIEVTGEVLLSYDEIPTTAYISSIRLGKGIGYGFSNRNDLSHGRLVLEFRDAQGNVLREKSTHIYTSIADVVPMPREWLPEGVSRSIDLTHHGFLLSLSCPPIFKYITIKWDGIELPLIEKWQR